MFADLKCNFNKGCIILTHCHTYANHPPEKGGICMKGSIYYRKDRRVWFVQWYYAPHNKKYKIYRYKGELIYMRHSISRKSAQIKIK